MVKFLNGLDEYLPLLLKPYAKKVYEDPSILDDFQVILLHGNTPLLLSSFFYKVYGIRNVRSSTIQIDGEDIPYSFSDKHMEMSCTDQHLRYIKSITKNHTISHNKYLFFIRFHHRVSPLLQHQLKNIIEMAPNAVFVLAAPSATDVDHVLVNMALKLSLGFPCNEFYDFYTNNIGMFGHECSLSKEDFETLYYSLPLDSIALILRLIMNRHTKIEEAIFKFIETCEKEKSDLTIISNSRDLSYKLFHLNYPISSICKCLLHVMPSHVHADLVMIASKADHMAAISKKDVLVYERFFIQSIQLLQTPPPKKRLTKKKS